MLMRASEILSPNGDGQFDSAAVEVSSNVAWELHVGDHKIHDGQGDAKGESAIPWKGIGVRADGQTGTLEHGRHRLRLHATKAAVEDQYATVAIDLKGPEVTDLTFKQGQLDAERRSYAFTGTATLKDVGFSEVDPDSIQVTVDDAKVHHDLEATSGKLTFKGTVPSKDQVKVTITAKDKVANEGTSEQGFNLDLAGPVISNIVLEKGSRTPGSREIPVTGTALIDDGD
ncbi:MAG: hypothetical protein ACLGIN_00865, partial [Candidatus Sericytochromatia bacterium]